MNRSDFIALDDLRTEHFINKVVFTSFKKWLGFLQNRSQLKIVLEVKTYLHNFGIVLFSIKF